MPKVYLTEEDRDKERWKANLALITRGASKRKVGAVINCSAQTANNRLLNPENITLKELSRLCRHYKVDRAKFLETALDENWR